MERRHIDRRSFLNGAGRFAAGALTVGSILETMRPDSAWARHAPKVTHPASARVLDRLRTQFTFQISVDVATLPIKATAQAADWATTSQEESDRNYGKKMREQEAREGKERKKRDKECRKKPDKCASYDGYRAGSDSD